MRPRKDAAILETAADVFLARGYEATSLDDIAAAGGFSKTTVYNNFGDKDALFRAVVRGVPEHSAPILDRLRASLDGTGPAQARLRDAARLLVRSVLNPDVVRLRRLAIAEASRFPDLAALYLDTGPGGTLRILEDAVRGMDARGELRSADPAADARRFAYAVLGSPQDAALLDPARLPTEEALLTEAEAVADLFVRAWSA